MSQRTGNGADFVVGTGSSQTITLEWTNPTSDSVTVTHFRYRADGDLRWNIIPCPSGCSVAKQTSYDLTLTLEAGTRVAYQVQGYEIRYSPENPYTEHTLTGVKMWENIPSSGASTTSHTVPNLSYGETRNFEVRAVNANGPGPASAAQVSTRPAKPTGFTAAARVQSADLSWTDPKNTTITKWEYRKKTAGSYGSWTQMSTDATATSYAVTTLTNNTAYTFQIRAVNNTGVSDVSDQKTATPGAGPAKPAGLSASARDKGAVLSWTATADTAVTGYEYQQKTAGAWGTAWTPIANSSRSTASHAITGLTNGTAYTFRIRALNSYGGGAASNEASATPVTAPAKPTSLAATPKANSVDLTWDNPNNTTITGWQYQFKTDGAYGAWNTMTSYLAARESYTTPSAVGAYQKTVSWINSNDANIDKYQYRTKPGNEPFGAWRDMPNSDSDTMSYTFTALAGNTRYVLEVRGLYSSTAASLTKFRVGGRANGTAHTFKIRAINPSGNGEASDPNRAPPPRSPRPARRRSPPPRPATPKSR